MADISNIARVIGGAIKGLDISANTLVTLSVKVGGGVSNTELTKAILDNLVTLQNGSDISASLHHHDSRYFTKAILGSTTGGSSGAKQIGVSGTPTNFTAASADIQAYLDGIDTKIGTLASASSFLDGTFNISNTSDSSKKINFSAAGISASTTRTITMPDANVDLGNLTNSNISASAAIALTKLAALASHSRALVSDASGFISESATTAAEIAFVSGVTSSIQGQINNLTSSIQNFEWQPSVISATLLSPPGSPSTGDRYLINGTGAGGWAGHNNVIAQWSGSAWAYTSPTTGTFVASDAEPSILYLFGGATWSSKAFEATTASTGLTKVGFDVQLASGAAGNGLTFTAGVLSVNTDNSTLEISAGNLRIKDLGVTTAKLAATSVTAAKLGSDVAGSGLSGGNGSALAVSVDNSTLEINAGSVRQKDAGTTAAKLNSNVADQSTITGGAGSALAVQFAPAVKIAAVAGQSFSANTTYAVRWGQPGNGETAGRLYACDKNAASQNNYNCVGIIQPSGAIVAGNAVTLIKEGNIAQVANDVAFSSGQVGTEAVVGTSGAIIAMASLAGTTNEAVFVIGMISSTTTIDVGGRHLRYIA